MRNIKSALIGLISSIVGTLVGGILLIAYGNKLSAFVTESLPFVGQFVRDNLLIIMLIFLIPLALALNIYLLRTFLDMLFEALEKQSQLKSLAKEVAELGQHLGMRHWYERHLPSPNTSFERYLNQLSKEMKGLSDKLSELDIESPEIIEVPAQDESVQIEQLNIWNTYLAMLLPLAASGRIHDSQQVLWRAKGEEAPVTSFVLFSTRPR